MKSVTAKNVSPDRVSIFKYKCYDCCQSYYLLNELIAHCRGNYHGEESCLKCREGIVIFEQTNPRCILRLHTCNRSLLRHQNTDLHVLGLFVSSKLDFIKPTNRILFCNSCQIIFPQTNEGFNEFLIHSNTTFHNCLYSCRRCTLPQFKVAYEMRSGVAQKIAHFCIKDAKCILEWCRILLYSFSQCLGGTWST